MMCAHARMTKCDMIQCIRDRGSDLYVGIDMVKND